MVRIQMCLMWHFTIVMPLRGASCPIETTDSRIQSGGVSLLYSSAILPPRKRIMASKPLTELQPPVTPVSSEVPVDLIPPLAFAPAIGDEGQEIVPPLNSMTPLEGQKALPCFDALRGPDSPATGWVPFRAPDETTEALPPVLCRQLSPYFVGEYLG